MKVAPPPLNEESRLECLYRCEILDTEAEKDFDDIARLASRVCQTPISTITLVDRHRQWFKAKVGVENQETPRDPAFCAHALFQDEIMVVPDAKQDERFFDNPFVTGQPNIRFYAGMPLTMGDGSRLGTLCVIDRQPRELSKEQMDCLRILGKQVMNLLELRLKVKELNQALETVEIQKASLQKLNHAGNQLLAVIGHDLRSPLATLCTLLDLGEDDLPQQEFVKLLGEVRNNTLSTMELLGDLLAWAENQFTGQEMEPEEFILSQLVANIIEENQPAFARKNNQAINAVPADLPVRADRQALSFMLRNLLLNANKFTENGKIETTAERVKGKVRVEIIDSGIGMTRQQLDKLFDPSSRSSTLGTQGEKGSGLGLQLCREFAERHGGSIGAHSEPGKGSQFYFTIDS